MVSCRVSASGRRSPATRSVRGYTAQPNTGSCVEIIAQGPFADVENFIRLVREEPPERASILKMDIKDIPEEKSKEYRDFQIIESVRRKERSLSPRILRSARSVRRSFLTRQTGGIFIPSSTARSAGRGLRFSNRCPTTANGPR